VDLRPGGAPARGYNGSGRKPRRTLTSGVRADGRKNLGKHLWGHMVTGEPMNVSGGSHVWLRLENLTWGLDELDSGPE
jgi:hypothetical protein